MGGAISGRAIYCCGMSIMLQEGLGEDLSGCSCAATRRYWQLNATADGDAGGCFTYWQGGHKRLHAFFRQNPHQV